jgi:hypothetical protein
MGKRCNGAATGRVRAPPWVVSTRAKKVFDTIASGKVDEDLGDVFGKSHIGGAKAKYAVARLWTEQDGPETFAKIVEVQPPDEGDTGDSPRDSATVCATGTLRGRPRGRGSGCTSAARTSVSSPRVRRVGRGRLMVSSCWLSGASPSA